MEHIRSGRQPRIIGVNIAEKKTKQKNIKKKSFGTHNSSSESLVDAPSAPIMKDIWNGKMPLSDHSCKSSQGRLRTEFNRGVTNVYFMQIYMYANVPLHVMV